MQRFTLEQIRQITEPEQLHAAAVYFARVSDGLTRGEFYAFYRTIQEQANKLGILNDTLNEWANEAKGKDL
jgi:hypothetical protein